MGLCPGEAKAILTYNIFQSGSDVVVSTDGSLDLGSPNLSPTSTGDAVISPNGSILSTGPSSVNMPTYSLTTIFNSFGNSSAGAMASSASGSSTYLSGNGISFLGIPPYLATNAISGSAIISSATFANKTLSELGLTTPGLIAQWRINTGTAPDFININVISAAAPVPGPLPLFGAGAAFGWSRRLRSRIRPLKPEAGRG
jgi:hypothetical protein